MSRSILGIAALATALAVSPLRAEAGQPKKGDAAPEFTFGEQIQGYKFKDLKSLRGKVVLIDFFGNW